LGDELNFRGHSARSTTPLRSYCVLESKRNYYSKIS
jgi:hypothetical protein